MHLFSMCAKGVQFYCPSRTYPAIPYYFLLAIAHNRYPEISNRKIRTFFPNLSHSKSISLRSKKTFSGFSNCKPFYFWNEKFHSAIKKLLSEALNNSFVKRWINLGLDVLFYGCWSRRLKKSDVLLILLMT